MAKGTHSIYFDKQDSDILALVNRIQESHTVPIDIRHNGKIPSSPKTPDRRRPFEDRIFDPNLHPHGIKEMVETPVSRMAYAVINLLHNLEAGGAQARDRLLALQTLYDEVLNSAHSALRRNTARVLMQIMKNMVRAHGQRLVQLKLAHDFRRVAQGTPRVVRQMLARYHLPEMPEEWNQIAFDDHVYDANTKGRKTPTHLIMDAWIKGLRKLTVAYQYQVSTEAAWELMRAAEITGITVRIGLEFQTPFYSRFANLFWIPRGFSSNEDFLDFLHSPTLADLMRRGKVVLRWREERILRILSLWNELQRPELVKSWGVPVPELSTREFLDFVGRGQPSRQFLSECLHRHVMPAMKARARILAEKDDEASLIEIEQLENLSPEYILDNWLSPDKHPELPDMRCPLAPEDMPALLRLSPAELVRELQEVTPGYLMVLVTSRLRVEDVMELLYDCGGGISHLEIFNMKGWVGGKMPDLAAIGELQRALTLGQGARIKQMVRQMLRKMEERGDEARAAKFREILHNLPKLWEHYRNTPLKSRMGTSSASRRSFGMGLVLKDTLPRRALKELRHKSWESQPIPISYPVEEQMIYRSPRNPSFWQRIGARLRGLPGCRHLGMLRRREWKNASEECRVDENGNVANLGGMNPRTGNDLLNDQVCMPGVGKLGFSYLNSTASNWFKVLLGFIPAFFSFHYTQSWWLLAWLGPFIWFGITGFRNVVQMVLAAMGATRGTLIQWKSQVNVNRICDSLMYTGISVLLLEVMVRVWLLEYTLGITAAERPILVFTALSTVNGLYIFTHNIFRGFPRQAAIGNIFRSILAIPVASLYNVLLFKIFYFMGVLDPAIYLVPSATVISKMASDTVAAIIEGYADSKVNLRMRRWDYKSKLDNLFSCCTRLEMLFPQEDALNHLSRPGGLGGRGGRRGKELETAFIIHALDLMYFWFYQPRAQEAFRQVVRALPEAERQVLIKAQLVLTREREISQMMVDGLLGRHFSRPLAFYLDKRRIYLKRMVTVCRPSKSREPALTNQY